MFKILLFSLLFSFKLYALTNSSSEENLFYNSVVFIKTEAPDEKGDPAPGFCNATLIKKNMIVTAAHCILYAVASGDNKIRVQKGAYKYIQKNGETRKIGYMHLFEINVNAEIEISDKLKDKITRNSYKTRISPDEDVAILWWHDNTDVFEQESFPEIIAPSEFNQLIKNFSTSKFQVTSINPFSESSTDIKRSAFLNNTKWSFTNYIKSKSTSRVEEGDSGAPLFVNFNGTNKIFAVVKGKASTVFDNWDVYTAITNISCEISKKLPSEFKIKECSK